AIARPMGTAAAAAAAATPLATARLFAPFMQLRCKAAGCFEHSFILSSFVSLALIIGGLGDRDLLDMRSGVVMQMFATAASTTAPPPPPPRSAFVGLGSGNVGFDFELDLFRLACLAANLFEIVLFFQRRDRGLGPLGNRFCRLGCMDLLAAIDHKSLRRSDGFIRANRNGDGEPVFQPAQMRTLLIEHIERDIRTRPRDQIVRRASDELLFKRAQYLQGQRRDRADMAAAAAIGALLG